MRVLTRRFVPPSLVVAFFGLMSGCGGSTPAPVSPSIASFSVSSASIAAGGSTNLLGVFSNGSGVIAPGNLPVTSNVAVSVSPVVTTTYTLYVTNAVGSATSQATVSVTPPAAPSISSFAASPAAIYSGGTSSLVGVFSNGTGMLTPGNIPVTSGTPVDVTPSATTVYTLTVTNAAGTAATQTASVTVTAPPSADDTTKNAIGMGTWFLSDWDGSSAFVDVFKQSRVWKDAAWAQPATVDALGWPTQDASTVLMSTSPAIQNGVYVLKFNGQAAVKLMWSAGSVSNQVYDSSTNTTTANVDIEFASTSGSMGLVFTNTKRTPGAASGTGFTNARLYRPGYPSDGSVVFTKPFLNAMSNVSVVRMMDWTNINNNYVVKWADRVTPNSATQAGLANPPYTAPDGTVFNGTGGVALEYQILLCNTLNVDCYINVPMVANDDYVKQMALVLAYGSDGTTPYSSVQSNPAYPPLNANLHPYIEYANEPWNTSANVSSVLQAICKNLPATHPLLTVAPNSPYNFWYTVWRYPAWRMATISQTFQSVFGPGAMMTRVRPLLETQEGNAQDTLHQALTWLDAYSATLSPATTIPGLLYGGGGSAYYGVINSSSAAPDNIFANGNYPDPSFVNQWAVDSMWTYNYGLKHVAYEGGPGINGAFSDAENVAINAEPRMESMVEAYQSSWAQQGGDLLIFYTLRGPAGWEFTPDMGNLSTPKLTALTNIAKASRAAVTLGAALPGTLSASALSNFNIRTASGYNATRSGQSCVAGFAQGTYIAYPAHTSAAFNGTLTFSGSPSNANTATQVRIWVNGVQQGTVNMAAQSAQAVEQSTALPVSLPKGLSMIRLEMLQGGTDFCSLTVQ